MDKTIILRSETEAYKAKRLLSKNGIASRIRKITDTKTGCSFSLCVKDAEVYTLIRILRDNGIEYSFAKDDLF